MRHTKASPCASYLKTELQYNPATGDLTWRWRDGIPTRINTRLAGRPAGSSATTNGRYVRVKLDREHYPAHRLIFKMMTGRDPESVDHIDGDGLNNKWENLREASHSQNACNRRSPSRDLPRGVSPYRGTRFYRADIQVRRKNIYLGRYGTVEAAQRAYAVAAEKYHGEFRHSA